MKQRVFLFVATVFGFCAPLSAQVPDLHLGNPIADSVPDVLRNAEPFRGILKGGAS